MRDRAEIFKRYILFAIGLFVNAMGVALIIHAGLGISPTAIIPYALSNGTSLSVGTWTMVMYIVLLIAQMIILGRRFSKIQLLQIPISILFGIFTDLCLAICSGLPVNSYLSGMLILLLGCIVRALGISIHVLADVVMLSGEAFIKAISDRFEKPFTNVKLVVDAAMVTFAGIISVLLTGHIDGIREGTIIGVLIIAPCSRFFNRKLMFVEEYLCSAKEEAREFEGELVQNNLIITLSTDFGSGGHKIGKIIADTLNCKLYDRNMAGMISRECGIGIAYAVSHDEKLYKNRLEEWYAEAYSLPGGSMDPFAKLFEAQKKVIHQVSHENCVIIGHCANYFLKDNPNTIHIHIHSDMSHRIKRLVRDYKISEKNVSKLIARRDYAVSEYYRHFTGENWKDFDNYHITIDSGLLETEETAEILLGIIDKMKEKI